MNRHYWVWVTGPDYYLDDDGAERRELDPGEGYEPGGWWTCHKQTEKGDLVLLYRSRARKDIAYLIETRSDAYSLLGDDYAKEQGWDYGCDFEVVEKFDRPLSLEEMKSDRALDGWGALRASFMRRAYAIPPDTWDHLVDRLSRSPKRTERRRRAAAKRYSLEREIEDRLQQRPALFEKHGFSLEFRLRQHQCRRGGRADLIYFEPDARRYVVVELKRGLAGRDAVAQLLSYRASVGDEMPSRRRPLGLLVGERLDNEAAGIVADDPRLRFISLAELGLDSR